MPTSRAQWIILQSWSPGHCIPNLEYLQVLLYTVPQGHVTSWPLHTGGKGHEEIGRKWQNPAITESIRWQVVTEASPGLTRCAAGFDDPLNTISKQTLWRHLLNPTENFNTTPFLTKFEYSREITIFAPCHMSCTYQVHFHKICNFRESNIYKITGCWLPQFIVIIFHQTQAATLQLTWPELAYEQPELLLNIHGSPLGSYQDSF